MYQKISEELLTFLRKSPSCFQAADQVREALVAHGFQQLKEDEKWNLEVNHSYFTMRNSSSVIAFTIPENARNGYRIMASHSDSPTFKIKENPEMAVEKKYVKLNVERYGGMLCAPWFDRPLSIAGRVITEENGELVTHLVNVDRDLVLIPNLAIHMNREVNDGYKYNAQKDMLPLYGDITAKDTFMKTIAEAAGVKGRASSGMISFSITGSLARSGELRTNLSPVDVWMICSVRFLLCRDSCGATKKNTSPFSVFWTTKKWEAGQSRELLPHSCMTH